MVAMANVSVILLLFFIIFGILGVQLFGGKFYSCNDPTVDGRTQCVGTFVDPSSGAGCWARRAVVENTGALQLPRGALAGVTRTLASS